MVDKLTEILMDALKQAIQESADIRLFRSGKLGGLFASRSGANGEAATKALQDGLLEVVRTETKGKTTTEWVRITPRGVGYLHDKESPVRVLEELRDVLKLTQEGVPVWMAQMQQDLRASGQRLNDEVQRMNRRLETLGQRVEEALRRADVTRVASSNGATISWASAALAYLDRRQEGGKAGQCPLPELFAALRSQFDDLSIPMYLDGLRRLNDRHAIQLHPFAGSPSDLPQPEYALLDGASVLYYVTR